MFFSNLKWSDKTCCHAETRLFKDFEHFFSFSKEWLNNDVSEILHCTSVVSWKMEFLFDINGAGETWNDISSIFNEISGFSI